MPKAGFESRTPAGSVWVVGVGPGDPALLHEAARALIAAADVVAGFATVLAVVAPWIRGQRVELTYRNQERMLERLAAAVRIGRYGSPVVVAWGDPSISGRQLVERVEAAFGAPARILPGISALQLTLARTGLAMEEVLFVTLHRRGDAAAALSEAAATLAMGRRRVVILPRPPDLGPSALAVRLQDAGVPGSTPAAVLERLSFADERAWQGDLATLAACPKAFSDLSVVVLGEVRYHLQGQEGGGGSASG